MPEETRAPSVFNVWLMLVLVGLVLFTALLNGQKSLAILCVLVLSMAAGARAWSRFSIARIRHKLFCDKKRLFPGEVLALQARFENKKFLPVWLRVAIAHGGCLAAASNEGFLRRDCGLLWYQAVDFRWQLRAVRRGVHRIGPLEMEAGDLLGFYPQKKTLGRTHEIIVYPRQVALNSVPLPRRDFFGIPGARSPIEDPVYLHGTRDYTHRRPARFIHWKASARHNRLQEKICEPAEQEKVLLLIRTDRFDSDPSGENFERCLEAAASLAMDFERRRYAVGLATNGRIEGNGRPVLPVSRSRNQLTEILETLARLEIRPLGSLLEILRQGVALPWGVTCVCFQFAPDDESAVIDRYFKNRGIPLLTIACNAGIGELDVLTDADAVMLKLSDMIAKGDSQG